MTLCHSLWGNLRLRSRGSPLWTSFAPILLVDLIQLVEPEQLPIAVVEQDIEGGIVRVSPPPGDGPLLAPQVRRKMIVPDPHPLAYLRFF
jgi:hypothetical protein